VNTVNQETRPVVVGLDGSDDALSAARWAAALAVRLERPLALVHAMPDVDEALLVLTAPQQADAGAYPRELGRAVLDRAADAVHADFPTLHVTRTLSHHSREDALTELSRRAHIVVLACADVSARGALLVGSTTLSVAARSACPVIAWRGATLARNDQPVVIGVDEDRLSRAALATAFKLADGLGVGLTAVYAMSSRRAPGEVNIPFLVDWEALGNEARQRLSDIVAPIAELWEHVQVTYVVEIGRARKVILDHAAEAQLVVVGTRGRGELASALLGSTGLSLLHHSPAPVAICAAPQPETEETHPEHAAADPASAGSH
jgi:nucleotide-binding universal stress UspA family protein